MIAIYLYINSDYRKWSLIGFANDIPEARTKALTRLKYLASGTKAEGRRIKKRDDAPEYPDKLSGIGKKVNLDIETNAKPKRKTKRKTN